MSFPQLPHSSSVSEIQASFSSSVPPHSWACSPATGSSSQKTQDRHRKGSSPRLSSVMFTSRRANRTTPNVVVRYCRDDGMRELRATVAVEERADPSDRLGEIVGPGERHDAQMIRTWPVESGSLNDEHVLFAQQLQDELLIVGDRVDLRVESREDVQRAASRCSRRRPPGSTRS